MAEHIRRYAVVGTGGRAATYIEAIAGSHRAEAILVAFCDISPTRMAYYNARLRNEFACPPVPEFLPGAFDKMIHATRPDVVIVVSPDATHHLYVIRAMELGCDVICEKPLTIDADKAKAIQAALVSTGRNLKVTFNFRYMDHASKVCQLMRDGVIGKPLAVDLSWMLDTSHGADYFRRWHREKTQSGGLQVHKSTHHFDVINWWIDSVPHTVFAIGGLQFYGRLNAEARGDRDLTGYDRYTGASNSGDPFALPLNADPYLKALYLDAEADSGYIRDRNVFGDGITSEDTFSLTARYCNGVILNYSLICYSPWEGCRAAITGTKGRIELFQQLGSQIITGDSNAVASTEEKYELRVYPMFGTPYSVPVVMGSGTHGGSDSLLIDELFSISRKPDPLCRIAGFEAGVASMLMGASANVSLATGQAVQCDKLFPGATKLRVTDQPRQKAVPTPAS